MADQRGDRTVRAATEIAGVGRSTLYEYFDDFDHALAGVSAVATGIARRWLARAAEESGERDDRSDRSDRNDRNDRGCGNVRERTARLKKICAAWIECVAEAPVLFSSALSREQEATSPLRVFHDAVLAWTRGSQQAFAEGTEACADEASAKEIGIRGEEAARSLMLDGAARSLALRLAQSLAGDPGLAMQPECVPQSMAPAATPAGAKSVEPLASNVHELARLLGEAAERLLVRPA